MAELKLSQSAKTDLLGIGEYTIRSWGRAQAARYLNDLEQCAKMLALNPSLGRPCDWIRSGLMRFEKGRHILFYRRTGRGILISRILHQSMLPAQQFFEETKDADPPEPSQN